MKAVISIFTALLVIVVSHYAHANDVKITRPKAQNGANDPSVQVIKEEKKSDKLTIADLKDFSTRTFDDRVLEFRRGDELITMIPLMDQKFSKERREAFEASQVLAEKLTKVWLEKAFHIRFDGNQAAAEQELIKMTASEIRKQFAETKVGGMPTRAEIIAAAGDARDAAKKLQERAKFMVEYDELIATFDKYQDEISNNDSLLKEKLMPSALLFVTNAKLPAKLTESLKKSRYLSWVGAVLDSSMTLTVTVRPWNVIKTNLNTGVKTKSRYFEMSTQAWAIKDFNTDKLAAKGPFKFGIGLLLGNFNRMANVHGGILGVSHNFNFKKSMAQGELPIPTHMTVSYGLMGAVLEGATGTLDIRDTVKHGYIMAVKEFGFKTTTGRNHAAEIGAVANLNAIASRFSSFDQETFNGIIEAALKEVPGADVMVSNNQVEIIVPDDSTAKPTEPKQETAPTPVNPVP